MEQIAGNFVFDLERLQQLRGALRLAIAERTGADPGPIDVSDSETHTLQDMQRAAELLEKYHPAES